jgi:phosphoglucosamine mutase
MSRKFFGTDGVRGKVGQEPITPDFVMRLGYAAGKVLAGIRRKGLDRPAVLIGKDTRVSGYMLESALRLSAGIVISASHNPYDDNGIKFFSGDGAKLPDATETAIERELARPLKCMVSARLGKARRIDDAAGRYIEFCKTTFPSTDHLRGMRIVIDCAHGAAYHVAPHVFHELGADVETVGVNPDGFNINDLVGATSPQALQTAVRRHKADLGIALDGDGDRLAMVDAAGKLYDGDQLLYVIARHRKQKGELSGGVAGTLMTNLALEHALGRLKVPFARAKVGDRYVLELLLGRKWNLGGENSGHIVCLDKHTTGDGIVSALQVLRALVESGTTLAKAAGSLELYPQVLINVPLGKRGDAMSSLAVKRAVKEVESELDGTGRVLLRPSGTEPLIRVMVEGRDGARVKRSAERIADAVRKAS